MPAADGGVIISRSKDGDIILSKDGAEPVDDEAEVGKEEGVGAAAASGGAVAGGIGGGDASAEAAAAEAVGGGGASAEAAAAEAVAFRAAAAAEDAVAEARRCTQFTCFTSTKVLSLWLLPKYKY
jgi:hypothetical protein